MELNRETLQRVAAELVSAFPAVDAVYLFGSLARGKPRPSSDIDLAVLLDSSAEKASHYSLEAAYAHFVEERLNIPVDVAIISPKLPLPLQFEMFQLQTILFARDWERAHNEACRARARYRDELPRLERLWERSRGRIKELVNALNGS